MVIVDQAVIDEGLGGVLGASIRSGVVVFLNGTAYHAKLSRLRCSVSPDLRHEADALFFQDSLNTADRVAFAIKQMADAFQQFDVVRPVISTPAATF